MHLEGPKKKHRAHARKPKQHADAQSKRGKETKTHDLIGPGNTETEVAAPDRRDEFEAERGAQVPRTVEIGAPPHHAQGTILCGPCTAIGWRAAVVLVPAILRPFKDVSVHIVQAECIWQFLAYRVSLPARVLFKPSVLV